MTTASSDPSVQLHLLNQCLNSGDCSETETSCSSSPTNNNNNTTPSVLKCVVGKTSQSVSSPPTIVSANAKHSCNSCCGGGSGPEERERDPNYKITENHLSTKVSRCKSAPYSLPLPLHTRKGNQDKSNHSQVTNGSNGSPSSSTKVEGFIATAATPSDSREEDQVMFDNVSSAVNSTNGGGIHNNLLLGLGLAGGITGVSGVTVNTSSSNHSNNMVIKTEGNELNGNNIIELSQFDNQFHHHHHHHGHHHFQPNGNNGSNGNNGPSVNNSGSSDCCMKLSPPETIAMQPHDAFGGHGTNGGGGGLFPSPSCAHAPPNCGGSVGSGMSGAGSMTSPGGSLSLDEHDCDDDKVINGDTFGSGELPDPDAIKMFVGQVPKHLNEPELRTLFEEFGRVFQINVLRDKVTKQSKGCCFVTFFTRKAALEAQNALHNVKTLPGMNHPVQIKPADNENRQERKLFVGMISRKCTETDIRNMFSRFGVIDECTVLRDAAHQSKGCAFVTYASKQSAQNALMLHHSTTMEGCSAQLVVKFADTQKDKDQKRQQTFQSALMGNLSATAVAPMSQPQPYISGLLKLEQILQQQLHQQQQSQSQTGYYPQLSSLGMGGLGGLTTSGGLGGMGSSSPSNDLATLAVQAQIAHLLANANQPFVLASLLNNHSSLSPTELTYAGANGCSLGSTTANPLSPLSSNGLQSGLSSVGAIRSSPFTSMKVNTKQTEGPEGANLFIYHLPPEYGDLDLAQLFVSCGNVISAKVFVDKRTNLSKCFGFVSYDSPASAQLAIQQMNGFQIGPKRLKVQLKRPKDAARPY